MTNEFVTDTMALVLHLEKRRFDQNVKSLFEKAEQNENKIWIPTMVVAEIGYLSEKHKIDCTISSVLTYCKNFPSKPFQCRLKY